MLQALLEERFKLVLKRETKEKPVFALTLAKGGPKLMSDRWIGKDTQAPMMFAIGFKGVATESLKPGSLLVAGRSASMADLAAALQSLTGTGRPVMDRTELKGEFNFDLSEFASFTYNYNGTLAPQSLFTALEEQLGLKLEATTALTEGLFVERIERPSAN